VIKADRKQQIIDNAREVFLQKGLFSTVMEDIADASSITRRTLYRYFETKEDIAFEVTKKVMDEMNAYAGELIQTITGTGLEKIERLLYGLIDYMDAQIETVKYLGEFDFYFKDDNYLTGL